MMGIDEALLGKQKATGPDDFMDGDGRQTQSRAHLPWVEKYRPAGLEDVVSHQDVLSTLKRFVSQGRVPHLMFYGPPGTGKTSTAVGLANDIYGRNHSGKVLELNASDERGIDVVREQIKSFAATRNLAFGRPEDGVGFKLVILDESDAMTSAAQNALRRVMEKYVRHVRFILICNYASQLIPAIQSRCTRFRFSPISREAMLGRMEAVIAAEGLRVGEGAKHALIGLSRGDMRRVLNVLQAAAATLSPGQTIDETLIYAVTASPHPTDLDRILAILMNSTTFEAALDEIRQVQEDFAIALQDIVTALFDRVNGLQLPAAMRVYLTTQLADLEYRLTQGTTEALQLGALVGLFMAARGLAK